MTQFWAFLTTLQRSYWRERSAVLWSFLFPVFLLVALGSVFSEGPVAFATIEVRDFDGDLVGREIGAGVEGAGWRAEGEGGADAVVTVPAHATPTGARREPVRLLVEYASEDPQKVAAIHGLLSAIVLRVNQSLDAARVPIQLEPPPVQTVPVAMDRVGGYAEFLVFGLVGLNVLSTALFGVGVGSSWFREQGVLRRLWLTPALPRHYLGAQLVHICSILVASTALLLLAGHFFFGTGFPRADTFFVVMILGSFALIPVGLAIAARTTKPQTTQMWANLLYFPLMLLSGVYFRPEVMTETLATVMGLLPLKPFLDALRAAGDGASASSVGDELAILALWGVAGSAFARGVFRWNQ